MSELENEIEQVIPKNTKAFSKNMNFPNYEYSYNKK